MQTATVKLPDIFVQALVDTLLKGQLLYGGADDGCREKIMKNPEAWMMSLLIEAKKDASDKYSTPTRSTLNHTGSEDSLTEAEKILREQKLPE